MSTTLFFILLAIISLGINGLLAWYVIQILRKLLYTSDNIGDLYIVCRTYESFIQQIYEMDMFYGEPVLEELIQRTKLVRMEIEKFQEIYGAYVWQFAGPMDRGVIWLETDPPDYELTYTATLHGSR